MRISTLDNFYETTILASMKTRHYFLLWISFFLTTAIVFGAIAIPSYHYWSKAHDVARSLLFGAVGSLTFGVIYTSY